MSRKSCEAEPREPSSQSSLEEALGPPFQQTQATSSRDREPLSSHSLSHEALVALKYPPFYCTSGQLLTEEMAPQPDVCKDQGGCLSVREEPFPEDSLPLSGFFPYYRSKEETCLPGKSCWGSRDPSPRREKQAGCFCKKMVGDRCSAASPGPFPAAGSAHSLARGPSLLVSAGRPPESCLDIPVISDAVFRSHTLCAAGFVPYYRSPEEGFCTSPGPPASLLGLQGPSGGLPRPGAATL